MMKRVLLIFLIASNLISAKDYNLFNQTKTKVTLKNEFGVAYPYAKVVFSSIDTNYVVSVDQNGQAVLNIQQGIEFTVSCFINENKYEFNEIIYIEKNKNIYEASIDLQFDLYEKIFEIKNLNFKSGKYDIEKQYFEELNNLVLLLTENKDVNIEIAGHTDSIGNELANQILSENRAKSVKSYLVKNNINHKRISCVGYGEKQPIENNSSFENRKKNRRIEIRIFK